MSKSVLLLSVALLCACQKKDAAPANEQTTAATPAPATPAASDLLPGRYRQVTTLLDFNDPSMPADMLAQAKKQIGTAQTEEQCVTPDMVSNPKEIIAKSLKEDCTVSRMTWDKGKVDVAFACPPGSEFAGADASIAGTYAATSYTLELLMKDSTGKLAKMKVDAQMVGDCN